MEKLNITKGTWKATLVESGEMITNGKRATHPVYWNVTNGKNRASINVYKANEEILKEGENNAEFIAESFNVANETGLTPRELLNQRNELLEALQATKEYCKYHDIRLGSGIIHQIETAINNASK